VRVYITIQLSVQYTKGMVLFLNNAVNISTQPKQNAQ